MDKLYMRQVLDRLIAERASHDEKFKGNPVHENCLPRFDKVIDSMRGDLGESPTPRMDFSVSESALPDAIEDALVFEQAAQALLSNHDPELAEAMKQKSREVVFKEMNELDGFDR
jgi:hypothetical protein